MIASDVSRLQDRLKESRFYPGWGLENLFCDLKSTPTLLYTMWPSLITAQTPTQFFPVMFKWHQITAAQRSHSNRRVCVCIQPVFDWELSVWQICSNALRGLAHKTFKEPRDALRKYLEPKDNEPKCVSHEPTVRCAWINPENLKETLHWHCLLCRLEMWLLPDQILIQFCFYGWNDSARLTWIWNMLIYLLILSINFSNVYLFGRIWQMY